MSSDTQSNVSTCAPFDTYTEGVESACLPDDMERVVKLFDEVAEPLDPKDDRRHRNYVMVSFRSPKKDYERYSSMTLPLSVRYFVGQVERCRKTGRFHLQMYIEFYEGKNFFQVKELLEDNTLWLAPRRSKSSAPAAQYCTLRKQRDADTIVPGTQWEHGDRSAAGQKAEIKAMIKMVDSGATTREMAREYPETFVRSNRGILAYRSAIQECTITPDLKVVFLFGDSGTMKSSSVSKLHGHSNVGRMTGDKKWFDYDGQKVLLFNDPPIALFKEGRDTMLEYLDIYDVLLPVKFGFSRRRCTHIYVAANWCPLEVFGADNAMMRRFRRMERRSIVSLLDEFRNVVRFDSLDIDHNGHIIESSRCIDYWLTDNRDGSMRPATVEEQQSGKPYTNSVPRPTW